MPIDPFFGSLALGGLSALGNLGGGLMGASGAAAQNAAATQRNNENMAMQWSMAQENVRQADIDRRFQLEEADKNRRFQMEMSSSAYQRAVADMRRAGINPMLAYVQGGASTSGGSAGSGSRASVSGSLSGDPAPANPGAELGRGVSRAVGSALDAYQTVQAVDNLKAQNAQIQANTDLQKAQQRREDAETVNKAAQTKLTEGQEKLLADTRNKIIAETGTAYAQSGYYGAAQRERDEQARRTRIGADKEEKFGFGTPADIGDNAEKLARRITEQLRAGNTASPIEKNFRPFTGLRNN